MTSGPKRTPFQREADLLEISRLYLQGRTQADIAARLGFSQQQISYDLKVLQKRWLSSSLVNVDEAKARELAKVDQLEREYWEAWERSKENAETEVTEQIGNRAKPKQGEKEPKEPIIVPERIKKYKRSEGQSGNPAFLAGVQWCINKRCEILGLDAPQKVAPTDPSGKKEYGHYTDEERAARIVALLDIARARRDRQSPGGTA